MDFRDLQRRLRNKLFSLLSKDVSDNIGNLLVSENFHNHKKLLISQKENHQPLTIFKKLLAHLLPFH